MFNVKMEKKENVNRILHYRYNEAMDNSTTLDIQVKWPPKQFKRIKLLSFFGC